jgi:hypothetical protein
VLLRSIVTTAVAPMATADQCALQCQRCNQLQLRVRKRAREAGTIQLLASTERHPLAALSEIYYY